MLGAIAGDIIGSIYEAAPIKTKSFPLFGPGVTFTDDTVCTVAVADCIMSGGDFAQYLRSYGRRYPNRGYGGMFLQWIMTDGMPAYGSWGNGAAMRVGAIAHLAGNEAQALELAAGSAAVSHDHPDAVGGAQAAVLAAWLARQGRGPDDIRPRYGFDISCKGTVPPAIVCALEADGYEDAIRNAISLGGDSDTLACITGAIAEVLFGLPDEIAEEAKARLDPQLRQQVSRFYAFIAERGHG